MEDVFKNNLTELAKKIGIDLDELQVKKYYDYMNILLEWNEKINLTAITEMNDVILKHFIDCITVMKYINEKSNILDVGSGAGFPGIPISILDTESSITLLDSLNKRVIFLQEVIKRLDLNNVSAIHSRAEEFGRNKCNREKYDVTVSRAVANLSTLAEYLLPFTKMGGISICMKGSNVDEEIKQAEFAIKELGGKIVKVDKFNLPSSDMERNIIVIKKIQHTPNKYPRKAGLPSKSPLGKY